MNIDVCLHNNLFHFFFILKWACSHAREEDGSAICSQLVRPQRTPFLMAQTQLSYIVIKKFLQSGSDRFPRRDSKLGLYKLHKSSKILSFYKADRKHIFSDNFSDVGRGLLCPSSIRLRCPDHETSHWLLLTCGWTSWVLRSQMIVHCSGWPMISKPRTAEFALHFINFIKAAPDITLIWHYQKFS